jgi:tetratricopeptide (TPR) repeat protein
MAHAVSDDYAFAYIEAALDAVPDQAEALQLLEQVAPRMGRSDTLAPRWLAAIRGARDPKLARTVRLKMATAYFAVGQLNDAHICLEPLLAEGDPEAVALDRSHGAGSATDAVATDAGADEADEETSDEDELSSSEMLLDSHEADLPDDQLASADIFDDGNFDTRDGSLADELSDLGEHLDDSATSAGARNPLEDLASIDRDRPAARRAAADPSRDLGALLDSGETSREELLDSSELSNLPGDSDEPVTATEQEQEPEEERRPTSKPPRLPPKTSFEPSFFGSTKDEPRAGSQLPREDDDPDPFAEQTQPRATPLTLAELTALTGEVDHNIILAPAGELKERDPDSEVTQLTPAEDPAVTELRSLRTELAKRLRFRDRRGAAEVAETLLDRGVFDADAIEALEEHLRLARDFKKLRDLSVRLAGELSFPSDVRSARLREAVMLSESKLGDQEGAIAALRSLLDVEPEDSEAFDKLRKLLKRGQRWDELGTLLSHRSEQLSTPKEKADMLRELGALARDKLNASPWAIASYVRAREIDPGREEDELALSELYLANDQFDAAADLYEARLARTPEHDVADRVAVLTALTALYEEKLHDDERTQRTLELWRSAEPRRPEPLAALTRVLERRGEHRALIDALTAQLELTPPSDRLRLHVRIAELSLTTMHDAARAADSYGEAILLSPQTTSLWKTAAPAFEEAGRKDQLDELLWGLAQSQRDRALTSALYDHLAETRGARADVAGAILAREAQYASNQELPALEALVKLLRGTDRASELSKRLDELAKRSPVEAARALRFERATVLADKLREPEQAKAELERLLSEIDPDDVAALRKLVELCIVTEDLKRRASAQERLIKLAPSQPARIELATELVDIYEHELSDPVGAARVLTLWTTLESDNPTPYMRLLPLLAQTGKKRELLDALDKLTKLAISDEESGEFLLRAARVAIELNDYDGAWNRLVPRVVEADDAAAERLLRELTRTAGRGEQLAAVYVGLAQRTTDGEVEKRRWADAARVFEQELAAYDRALEAMLRALAKQLDNRELLGEVERLAERAQAWQRLAQVYDSIVRKADTTADRIQLLVRHARLLEARAGSADAAFERIWLAFQLDPANDGTYADARRLAQVTGKQDELLGAHERRAQSSASREARIEALLEACALAQHELEDLPRATGYLARAVSLAGDAAPLLDNIEAHVRVLDDEQPAVVHGRGLLAELTGVYAQLAQEGKPSPHAAAWLSRAARIHEVNLEDPDAAYRALERASSLAPSDEQLLDELNRVAALGGNWEAFAKHLQQAADSAIDSNSSSASLSRLGALCERELASPSRAADAYEQLVRLRPKDAHASRRLRQCLRAAERFDELLIAIDRELFMLKPEEGKRELLKQAAETWEFGLKNRYEALDAWKKVIAIAPADPDAVAALLRLRSQPRADDSLLDEEVVVLPEDLRPSLVGAATLGSSLFSNAAEGNASGAFFAEQRARSEEPVAPRRAAEVRAPVEAARASTPDSFDAPDHEDFADDELRGRDDEQTFARIERPLPEPAESADDFEDDGYEDPEAAGERVSGEVGVASQDEESELNSAELDVAEFELPEFEGRNFDADVTLPLDRSDEAGEGAESSVVSLEGLSSLLERSAPSIAPPPPPPSANRSTRPPAPLHAHENAPPAPARSGKPSSRVPPPPPRRQSDD